MICGYLSPGGKLYSCPRYGHMSMADKIVSEYGLEKSKSCHISEDILLNNGWICIRTSDAYKGVYDDNGNLITISDEQKKFLKIHRSEFHDVQLADIDEMVRDFDVLEGHRKNGRA